MVCGTEFEKEDVPKEYLYNNSYCSIECNKKYMKEYREEKKNSGKCIICGESALEDSVHCQECLDKFKEYRERYKREGKCPICGEPALEDSVCCQECMEKQKERRERLKREGKCPKCGDELPDDGRNWDEVCCPECQEKDRNNKFYGEYATREELLYGKSKG